MSLLAAVALAVSLDADLRAVAALPGQPSIVAAAGLTSDGQPILTLENPAAFDPESAKHRAIIFGSTDTAAAAVLEMVRWFKRSAPKDLKNLWEIVALPHAAFDPADLQSRARWMHFQAPDLAIEVVEQNARPIGPAVDVGHLVVTLPALPESFVSLFRSPEATERYTLHGAIVQRVERRPILIATLLAKHYPDQPSISYIPSVAWVNTLKLAPMAGDPSLEQKVRDQTAPWIKGAPLFGQRIQLTSVAGTMVFAELGGDALPLALQGAKLAAARKADGVAEYGQGWTDDMFMSSAILARVGKIPEHRAYLDAAAKLLIDYATKLQRPDGIFIHAVDGPHAWGRGNGFAAFGLMETLTALPAQHPQRPKLLEIYRRHMTALKAHQSPDGMWREVIDEPGAYREFTATAMLMTAMARGIRLGWLDKSFTTVVERAWHGVAAHIKDDGTVMDVCTGTGAGPTKKYYLDRAAITGADDRGGAMALFATMEWMALEKKR